MSVFAYYNKLFITNLVIQTSKCSHDFYELSPRFMNFFMGLIRTIHTITKVADKNSPIKELKMNLSVSRTEAVAWGY